MMRFVHGRCVLSAMAGLQLDHSTLVLKAMQLRSTMRPQATQRPHASVLAASSEPDAAGFAAAVMVLERVFAELEAHLSQPSVTDWAVLMVGYVVLGCLAVAGMSWLPVSYDHIVTSASLLHTPPIVGTAPDPQFILQSAQTVHASTLSLLGLQKNAPCSTQLLATSSDCVKNCVMTPS